MSKYTVHDVSKITGISTHTIRYYDNENLIPEVSRNDVNTRIFSEMSVNWLYVIHTLRYSGLPIKEIRNYIDMVAQGDSSLQERLTIMETQEAVLYQKQEELKNQLQLIQSKRKYYQELLQGKRTAVWEPHEWKNCLKKFSTAPLSTSNKPPKTLSNLKRNTLAQIKTS